MNNVKSINLTDVIKSRLFNGDITKLELSEQLGISRVTLDTRLQKGNWKKGELHLLKSIV